MSGKGARFMASLFGIRLSEDAPQIDCLVPARITSKVMSGQLPTFKPSTLMLAQGENCHYMDNCAMAVKKHEKSYHSKRSGGSYRLTKNYTMRSGSGITRPIEQEWYEFKSGVVFITNKRIIFLERDYGFEKKIKDLTAVVPYSDAISLQFGNNTITLMINQPEIVASVLQMIH